MILLRNVVHFKFIKKTIVMAGILDLLNSPMGKQIISGVSSQTGQSTDKTGNLLSMAMPVLMGAMQRNASTQEGAKGLLNALSGKHTGGILDNLEGVFDSGVDQNVTNDGAGILGHILGSKQPAIENALSQKSGVDAGSVGEILKVAAPILMGVLGKQAAQNNVSDTNGLTQYARYYVWCRKGLKTTIAHRIFSGYRWRREHSR